MNKKLLIGIIVGVALLGGIGVSIMLLARRNNPAEVAQGPAPTSQPAANLTLTSQASSTNFTASGSASIDLFLNTGSTNIDGFQFIATLNGDSTPTISDSDSGTPGIQIEPAPAAGLTVVTNSVISQNGDQIVRYAMITQNPSQPFVSDTPTKIATIHFTTAAAGSLKLEFSPQNTRANRTGSSEETFLTTTAQNYMVASAAPASEPIAASDSASLAAASAALQLTPAPTASAAATKTSTTSAKLASAALKATPTPAPGCSMACLADTDCSGGLACIGNSCVNPSCPNSPSCSCTTTASPTPTPKTKAAATPKASATPKPTATAAPVPQVAGATTDPDISAPTSTIAALPKTLPQTGAVEDTILLLTSGTLCIVAAGYFMLRWM